MRSRFPPAGNCRTHRPSWGRRFSATSIFPITFPRLTIAAAFLVPEATMAQRISRAKQSIRASGVAFELPTPGERHARLGAVLHNHYGPTETVVGCAWFDVTAGAFTFLFLVIGRSVFDGWIRSARAQGPGKAQAHREVLSEEILLPALRRVEGGTAAGGEARAGTGAPRRDAPC